MLHTCYVEGIDGRVSRSEILYNEDSSMEGTELSDFLKWNLISLKWNKLTQMTS